jgi:hypothetical protein
MLRLLGHSRVTGKAVAPNLSEDLSASLQGLNLPGIDDNSAAGRNPLKGFRRNGLRNFEKVE